VRDEKVLRTVKWGKNIINTIYRKKAIWIGHILRRNSLLKHPIEGSLREKGGKPRKKI